MNTYAEFKSYIAKGKNKSSRKIANDTSARIEDDKIVIRFHNTDICLIDSANTKSFFVEGWKTSTSKNRINDLLQSPLHLYQEKGIWKIHNYQTKETYKFRDGITVYDDCKIENYDTSNGKEEISLRKSIRKYAKDFLEELISGNVSKPSEGDCWYCYLVSDDNESLGERLKDNDHLLSHIEEKYYVPSLFYVAIKQDKMSIIAESTLYGLWENDLNHVYDFGKNILKEQGYKSLVKYLYKQFGLVY